MGHPQSSDETVSTVNKLSRKSFAKPQQQDVFIISHMFARSFANERKHSDKLPRHQKSFQFLLYTGDREKKKKINASSFENQTLQKKADSVDFGSHRENRTARSHKT
jgi:hypothetical protein